MSSPRGLPGVLKPLRIGSALLICSGAAVTLAILGRGTAALGVGIGFGLYLSNVLLIAETARALIEGADSRRARLHASLSSVGRLGLLAVVLSLVAVFLGRGALLGACGGLLAAQVNLHVPRGRGKEGAG
jgi:hypothetical protein